MSNHIGGRRLARSQALQLLFQAEANGRTVEDVLNSDYVLSEWPLDPYGESLALGTDALRHDLDGIIATRSQTWSVTRMPPVDRNLLRLALYEMLEVDDVAVPVVIDETVELAKAYGSDDSSHFINGLLGRVADDLDDGVDVYAKAREVLAQRAAEKSADDESEGGADGAVPEPADGADASDSDSTDEDKDD